MDRYGRLLVAVTAALVLVGACHSGGSTERPATESNLTPGMAQMTIIKNKTVKAEIMETFGPPDLITHKDNLRVWTYDKIRYDVERTKYGLAILGAVGGSSGGGVGGAYGSKSRETSSSTSTILIIYFDEDDVVRDYRMQVTRF